MARIQILQLPACGRDGEQPFALIVDQCETPQQRVATGQPADGLTPEQRFVRGMPYALPIEVPDPWQAFGQKIGASGVMVTPERVDIVDGTDEDAPLVEFDHGALMETVKTAVRVHLESAEASDAFRAEMARMARRAATAGVGR